MHRRLDGLTAWSLAGWLLVRDRPEVVHDVGTQLSFAATLGILMWHRSRSLVGRPGWWRAIHSGLAISVVATVFTAPVAWPTFGRLPVVFPMANLLAAPSAMVLAGLGGIQVMLPDVFCVKALAAWCSATFVNAVVWMAEWRHRDKNWPLTLLQTLCHLSRQYWRRRRRCLPVSVSILYRSR